MKKVLFSILALLLVTVSICARPSVDLTEEIEEIEPRTYIYSGVVRAYCQQGTVYEEQFGEYTTLQKVVDYYYVEYPLGGNNVPQFEYDLVVVFADGSQSNVVVSDNSNMTITDVSHPNTYCYYQDLGE